MINELLTSAALFLTRLRIDTLRLLGGVDANMSFEQVEGLRRRYLHQKKLKEVLKGDIKRKKQLIKDLERELETARHKLSQAQKNDPKRDPITGRFIRRNP